MRLVGYTRVSTEEQAEDGVSLSAQEHCIEQYCHIFGHELVRKEQDVASAKSMARSGLKRALEILQSGGCDGLIISKLDRLTRSVDDLCKLLKTVFVEKKLVSVSEQFDTNTAGGKMLVSILTVVAEWERGVISERTKAGLAELKRQGVPIGGMCYGRKRLEDLDADERRIIAPDERELLLIGLIMDLRKSGKSYAQIVAHLTEKGYTTKKGKKWHVNTVRRIIGRGAGR